MAFRRYDPGGFVGLEEASQVAPMTQQSELDKLLAQLGPEPVDPLSGPAPATYQGNNLLESMAGLENQNLPAPRGFGESLLQGFAGGIGRAGTRASMARQEFEQSNASRQALRDQDNLARSREYRQRKFELTKDFANRKPEKPAPFDWATATPEARAAHTQEIEAESAARTRGTNSVPERPGKPEKTKLVEVTNPDGSKSLVPEKAGLVTAPKGGAPGGKPPTEAQNRASAFYDRAKQAVGSIEGNGIEDRIASSGTMGQFGLKAPNFMQSDDQKAYNQAKQAFVLALNRQESGASISPQEFERVDKAFFVQPGDGPRDIARKRVARQSAIDNLGAQGPPGSVSARTRPPIESFWKP